MVNLEKKNKFLMNKLQKTEFEKAELSRQEREKIGKLVTEFENVRKELDQVWEKITSVVKKYFRNY